MTTRIEAANARATEAKQAWDRGDYAEAARDYTLAAEQLEAIWHGMHGGRGTSPDAGNMRREARAAILRRDAQENRIVLKGKIGGWQN
jgi:hypothetical protein